MLIPWENNLWIINLYRLSPNRESKLAIGTLIEMGIVALKYKLLRYSQTSIEIQKQSGSAAHINLSEHLTKEQYKSLLEYAAKVGCSYLTFNVPNSECTECGFITKTPIEKCPHCGSEKIDYYDRVIGYLTKIKNWSKGRRIEQKTRVYDTLKDE